MTTIFTVKRESALAALVALILTDQSTSASEMFYFENIKDRQSKYLKKGKQEVKTKLRLKVFTEDSAGNLEAVVNEWISNQYPMIDIENEQVSTTTVSNSYDSNTIQTEYHAAIWYHEL